MLGTGILDHCLSQAIHSASMLSGLQLETLAFNSDRNGSIIFISGDRAGQSLSMQIIAYSEKKRQLWIYGMCTVLLKDIVCLIAGNNPFLKISSYLIEFIRSGHRMRILVPSAFMAHQTMILFFPNLTALSYILDYILILMACGRILSFLRIVPIGFRH